MNHKSLAVVAALACIAFAPTIAFAQSVTYSNGLGSVIPDNNAGGISSTLLIADNFVLADFTSITIVGLQHTWVGDLTVTLSHGGTTVDIIDRVIGSGDRLVGSGGATVGANSNLSGSYTFVTTGGANFGSAAAATGDNSVVSPGVSYATVPVGNTNPSGGVSTANGLLSDFAGMNVSGTWTLNISDRRGGNVGSFSGWRFAVFNSDINTNRVFSDASYSSYANVRVGNNSSADLTLVAGAVMQNVRAFNNSRVVVSGGEATSLRSEDNAKLYMNYGTVSGAVTVSENSVAFINGGTVGSVVTSGNARAYITDGTFSDLSASGNSETWVYGGNISRDTLYAYDNGAFNIFGDDLLLDFATATRGDDGNGILGTFYDLTGTLTDGAVLNTRFFDADGGYQIGQTGANAPLFLNNAAVAVPETGTLPLFALAGIGTLGLVARRKC